MDNSGFRPGIMSVKDYERKSGYTCSVKKKEIYRTLNSFQPVRSII